MTGIASSSSVAGLELLHACDADSSIERLAAETDDDWQLRLLEQHRRSWWKYLRLTGRAGARAAPGEEGTGIDSRVALEFALPFADPTDDIAVERERLRRRHEQSVQQERLAVLQRDYVKLREEIRAEVVAQLAQLEVAQTKLAAAQQQLERRRQQAQLIAKRVESGVEYRSGLWQAQDRIAQLEEAAALLQAQQKHLRAQIAMQAGAAWQHALERLAAAAAWLPASGGKAAAW